MAGDQRHTPYHDLLENIAGGCVVCRLSHRSVGRYLDTLSYESVTDPGVRERLRAARGLCHRHGEQYLDQTRDPLGLAIINRDLLLHVLDALGDGAVGQVEGAEGWLGRLRRGRKADRGQGRAASLAVRAECPACAVQREAERRFVGTLGEYLLQPAIHAAYANEGQLCLSHFALALDVVRDPQASDLLVSRERALLQGLEGELGEYVRKSDYRFRHEALGAERDAPARSLDLLTGSD